MADHRQVPTTAPFRVLRISHSSVVSSWRKREQGLRDLGIEVTLVTARSWQEGGGEVKLDASADENVLGVTTFGSHPCGFLYDPTALWKALRSVPHDVLDVHEEPYSVAAIEVVMLRWLARRRQPLVFYSAQNLPKRHSLPVRLAERVVLAVAKGAYPCNEAAAANLRRKAFRGTIQTIPLGVDPPAEALRPHNGTLAGSTEGPHLCVHNGLQPARLCSWQSVAEQQAALYRSVSGQAGPPPPGCDEDGEPLAVQVVVVAYGHPQMLETALSALRRGSPGHHFPVVVVDNSSDAKVKSVTEAQGAVYIDPGSNLGFATAVNLALREYCQKTSDVLLLNPDAQVDGLTVLALHRRLHSEARLACTAPAQQDLTGNDQRVAWPFPTPSRAWMDALGVGRFVARPDFLVGSVLLLNGAALEDVGPFDDSFFLYAEETDWQRRARAKGWGVRLCKELNALHVGGGTSSQDRTRRDALFAGALERYFRKWYGPVGWRVAHTAMLTGALVRVLLLRGNQREGALLWAKRIAWAPLRRSERLVGAK
jgi:GT2 family glycosyltransferase